MTGEGVAQMLLYFVIAMFFCFLLKLLFLKDKLYDIKALLFGISTIAFATSMKEVFIYGYSEVIATLGFGFSFFALINGAFLKIKK